jgi:serine/threonine protein kinase
MAPELLVIQESGLKVDVWSLGCILYQMMTGTTLCKSSSLEDLKQKMKNWNSYELKDIVYSDKMENLLTRMLDIDPDQRISAENILKRSFHYKVQKSTNINPEYPLFVTYTHPNSEVSESLYFPFQSDLNKGIFDFLSQLPISEFVSDVF